MLNISPNSIKGQFEEDHFQAMRSVNQYKPSKYTIKSIIIMVVILLIFLFIPWTQNIRSKGLVTTLRPDQRPQTIHSIIAGQVEKWYVQEGNFVKKGDTILKISEIKDNYLDPELVPRTDDQIKAKERSVSSYMDKTKALDNQIDALNQASRLKLDQTKNKIEQAKIKLQSDSLAYQAAKINFEIAEKQYERIQKLHEQGLKSRTELENRKQKQQEAKADMMIQQNKWLTSKNELINSQLEWNAIRVKYKEAIAKAESQKFTTLSQLYEAEGAVTKLQNLLANYSIRQGLYYITAPIDGYITLAIQSGIGETIKEGEAIVSIMPSNYELAIAMYVKPMDLPLLETGQHVRIQFDGWPAIVFSGWPNTSYGTYGGKVFAIDQIISNNGKYRVLVAPDTEEHPWPSAVRVGAGANNMLLLKDVPIWYELWRRINGFPPDYYKEVPKTSPNQPITEPKEEMQTK